MTGAVPEWAVLDRKDIEQSDGGSDAVAACWTAIEAGGAEVMARFSWIGTAD